MRARRIIVPALCASALFCGYSYAQTNLDAPEIDSEAVQVFVNDVRHSIYQSDFDQLENTANLVRSGKARFTGGEWKLRTFYAVVQGPGRLTATDAAWNAHIEKLQKWAAAKPDSITPRVALGAAYLRYAWKARGNGFSNTVTPDGMKLFEQRVAQARSTLEAAEALPSKDPHLFVALQTVALAQGWTRDEAEHLVEQAFAIEPSYFYVYRNYANFLLPKWYGKPGEAEKFVESISTRVGGAEGNFVYFKIAADFNCCRDNPQMPGLSWDRFKQGFHSGDELYGTLNHARNIAAFMAVRQGDQAFARELFGRIGDDWDQSVWGSKENFDSHKVTAE